MSKRARQHTVAKMHLLGFANKDEKIAMRRRAGDDLVVSVKDATVQKNFYTFINADGARDISIESWFSTSVEGPAAADLRDAREATPPDGETRPAFALYLAAMLLRNRLIRHRMDETAIHAGPMLILPRLMRKAGITFEDLTPVLAAELGKRADAIWNVLRERQDPREERRQHLRIMLRKIDEHAHQFESWHYTVTDADDADFVTSDTAVATIEPRPAPGWRGLLPPGAILAVPVNPRRVIIASEAPSLGTNPDGVGTTSTIVNRHILNGAFDAIFRHPGSGWPLTPPLAPDPPSVPNPTRTLRPSAPEDKPTFPATYPKIHNADIQALLNKLGAVDQVD